MHTINNSTINNLAGEGSDTIANGLKKKKYFFITDTTINKPYQHNIQQTLLASSYKQAKEILLAETPPDLIVIDLPLQHIELIEFKVWLTASALNNIPIIYSEAALHEEHIQQLFRQKLVDDVMFLDDNFEKLSHKVVFFQKYLHAKSPKSQQHQMYNGKCKKQSSSMIRILDVLLSACALLIFSPLFLLIAIMVKLESKGPIFYSSPRAGKGFKIFNFYKFRTMVAGADKKIEELSSLNLYADGSKKSNFFKIKDDPRITKFGKFLRNSSLDELPQLFNVLKGDMSMVGNRPLPLYEATTLTTNEWAERFMAPAGITGLWQITKRGKADMSNEERILLDITYARSRTLKGDLKILIQTPAALLQKANV